MHAGVARVGLVGVPCPCGAGRTFGGCGALEAWQTAAVNAYKQPLLRPWGALEPLLWPCGGFCAREWRVVGLLGYLCPAELGGLLERLEGLRPGKRQPWKPIRSHCCGRGVPFSHCCGLVVAVACGRGACWACWGTFACGVGRTCGGFGGFGAFEAWQTAALNAYKQPLLRPWGALEPLLWPCGCFCLRAWRVLGLLGYLFPAELGKLLGLRPRKRQPWTPRK